MRCNGWSSATCFKGQITLFKAFSGLLARWGCSVSWRASTLRRTLSTGPRQAGITPCGHRGSCFLGRPPVVGFLGQPPVVGFLGQPPVMEFFDQPAYNVRMTNPNRKRHVVVFTDTDWEKYSAPVDGYIMVGTVQRGDLIGALAIKDSRYFCVINSMCEPLIERKIKLGIDHAE